MHTTSIVVLSSIIYATLRYNVFKGVLWSDWPLYVLNKAAALSALLLLVITVIRSRMPDTGARPTELRVAGILALVHVLVSLTLLSPAYFPKFYTGEHLSALAGSSLLAGAGATAAMITGRRGYVRGTHVLPILAFVVGCHAALLGITGWFSPYEWPGGMPPITLISFVGGFLACAVSFLRKNA